MGRKSSVHKLPADVRRQLDRLLLENKLTLDQLREFVASCSGVSEPPSRSAIHRYYESEIKETAAVLRESREIAAGIAQEMGPESVEGEQGRLLVEMLRSMIFKVARKRARGALDSDDAAEAFDAAEFARLTRAIRDLSQAMRLEQDFARRIREEERARMEEEMRKRVLALGSAQDLKRLTDAELEQKIAALTVQHPAV